MSKRILLNLAYASVFLGASSCTVSGTVRGGTSVAAAVKSCPEVTNLVGDVHADWSAAFGIEAGDASTLKAALNATATLDQHATSTDEKLKGICSKLSSDLGTPLDATTGQEACRGAAETTEKAKAQLGPQANVSAPPSLECKPDCEAACDPAAPQGACARERLTVSVSGASDPEAAARYSSALEIALPAIIEIIETESDSRAVVGNAKAAIELGLTTGKAISEGEVASAVAAAACILPPLYKAKKQLDALRAEMRLLRAIVKNGGRKMPEPSQADAPTAAHVMNEEGSLPNVAAPLDRRIIRLFSLPEGGFAAQTHQGIVTLPGGTLLMSTGAHGLDSTSSKVQCAVGPRHHVACLREEVLQNRGQVIGTQLILTDSSTGPRIVERVSSKGSIQQDGIAFDATGTLLYAYDKAEQVGDRLIQTSIAVRGNQSVVLPFRPEHGSLEEVGGSGRGDPPIQFFEFNGRTNMLYRDGRTLLLAPLDRPGAAIKVAERTAYDTRPVVGGDGILYIFYHEPKSRTARVARSSDGWNFQDLVLDTRESGWQLEAVPTADGAVAVYYYYRSSYNKGLRSVALHAGAISHRPNTIMLERRWNAGWHPHLVCDHGREVWLTYLSNVEAGTRVWSHLNQPSELFDYAVKTQDDDYKNWFVQVGAGAWYTFWTLHSSLPKSKNLDGAHLNSSKYHVDPALLVSANLEARWGPVDLGLSYAQNYVDKTAKSFGDATRILSGNVNIADLLPGHDLKVEGLWGHYRGRLERPLDTGGNETVALDTNYVDVHLYALNQWRIKYGLAFTHYAVPTPIQTYYALAGETHYAFGSSELRNTQYNNVAVAIGYSMLDYVAKYENHYFGPIADVNVAVGLALASFDAINTPAGDVGSAMGVNVRGQLQLGLLWMNRFESLARLGFYVRPLYTLEGGWSGPSTRPDDRKTDEAKSADKTASFELESLRHGPWLDMGIIW
jgi:hypothetical protein